MLFWGIIYSIKTQSHIRVLLLSSFLVFCSKTYSQPWLSTRFAQNCAGCHAPGRANRPFSERRCTLSCQGCHVNPNGGGVRSSYGTWVKERWLHSFFVPGLLTNKRSPAPFELQKYGRGIPTSKSGEKAKRLPMLTVTEVHPDEKNYDRSHEVNGKLELDEQSFEAQLPVGDPYTLERLLPLTAGADFRYFVINRTQGTFSDGKSFKAFPMSADLGVRFRPIESHLSFVAEARFLNGPFKSQLEKFFTEEAQVRSAYLITDNWPLNSYLMAGLYRPLFGYYTPDHSSLAQTISGLGARSRYLAVSAGTSPNVPFLNLHLIQPQIGQNEVRGFVGNLGARFVTLGASMMVSYWHTKTTIAGLDLAKNMLSVTAGAQLWRTTLNLEFLRVDQEFTPGLGDAGDVYTVDSQTRLWREFYFVGNFAYSNINRSLGAGNCYEYMLGFKNYFISGTDTEILYIRRKNEARGLTSLSDDIQLQFHFFI